MAKRNKNINSSNSPQKSIIISSQAPREKEAQATTFINKFTLFGTLTYDEVGFISRHVDEYSEGQQ